MRLIWNIDFWKVIYTAPIKPHYSCYFGEVSSRGWSHFSWQKQNVEIHFSSFHNSIFHLNLQNISLSCNFCFWLYIVDLCENYDFFIKNKKVGILVDITSWRFLDVKPSWKCTIFTGVAILVLPFVKKTHFLYIFTIRHDVTTKSSLYPFLFMQSMSW